MNEAKSLSEQLTDSANEFWEAVGGYLPKLFAALVLLIAALIVAKIARSVVEKALKLARVDKLTKNEKIAKTLKTAEMRIDLVSIAGRTVFWVIIIIFGLAIADVLGLAAMRDVIRELLGYLPNVLAAAIVLTVTVAGARLVRDVVAASLARMQVDFAGSVAAITFYVLMLFGIVMAIDQLGFETTIITANITIIVAGIMLAFGLAFGLGGRETAGKIVENAYSNYKKTAQRQRKG